MRRRIRVNKMVSDMATIGRDYALAFGPQSAAPAEEPGFRFRLVTAGRLLLPSGRIVACDPLVTGPRHTLQQVVLPGKYAVDLALRETGQGEEYVAMARLLFNSRMPTVWVPAAAIAPARPNPHHTRSTAFRSESGTAAFLDADAMDLANFDDFEEIDDLLYLLTGNYRPHRFWMEYGLDRRYNMVLFSSGRGAGVYTSYFGIDAGGDIAVLVTDFDLLVP